MHDPWWKTSVAYQIYPRSFADADGDGVGDIAGIVSKLDHLADLGIGFIWLSPVYCSPMADNGYDISDYRAIAPEFGTMVGFDRLLAEAKARGIGIVMDLVVNHSSDEHAWFRAARESRDNPMRDFYIWRDPGPDGGPPNDLASYFGGPAWSFDEATGQYYFHLFDRKQPDLNWANPALRAAVWEMMNWWFDKGIAGFRMDVIDLIGKDPDRGITADGPSLFDHLAEMQREVLDGRDVVTVGEAWSASPENALRYCGQGGALSMVFQFSHVTAGWDPVFGKWTDRKPDLVALKRVFNAWQSALAEEGWNSLFWSNHDLPRAVSKYGDDGEWRVRSAKALATVLHLMKGTPYIYQGEEIGMTNTRFDRLDAFDDVEVHGQWPDMRARGLSEAAFLAGANANGRDNARTPMQWDASAHAGFTTGTPWLAVNPNYPAINAAADRADPDGIFAHYRHLVALRKARPIITHGRFVPLAEDHPAVWAYAREHEGQRLTMVANLSGEALGFALPPEGAVTGACLVTNLAPRASLAGAIDLAPWEAVAVLGPA
ncbi:alpha-glucosidase [Sinisalibacter aestuarii]|uniref:Glucan 1,6-alpha-glucosidase n=1 Tax=Sinisalibacter aestuarii TaxID=2949426 RepID=A0ABQ5LU57_9RHOB|nr:alpha-glucosidase [Sinisalibacter aestuarii]GKY88419.1 glucan 1,6-alpha-glucosidase [Sinisalibacter aestuarii]